MAQAFGGSAFAGSDYHDGSITAARKAAAAAGVADRATFEVATAKDYSGAGYDLVTHFDCLQDMGDPVGAAAYVRQTLAPDGTWMIVEPAAGDRVEDNLNPVGRIFYSASTVICLPVSRTQEPDLGLGAQAGEARIRDVVERAGFSQFRRATETPFNNVYESGHDRGGRGDPGGAGPVQRRVRSPRRRCGDGGDDPGLRVRGHQPARRGAVRGGRGGALGAGARESVKRAPRAHIVATNRARESTESAGATGRVGTHGLRSLRLSTLPVALRGSSSTKCTSRGTAKRASRSRTRSRTVSASSSAPGASTR